MMIQFEYFVRVICLALHLDLDEQAAILGVPRVALLSVRDGALTEALLYAAELIDAMVAIYAALGSIYSNDTEAECWLRRPNTAPPFGGLAPLDVILRQGPAAASRVAQYLESAASADFS